jgi:hypothetical protein
LRSLRAQSIPRLLVLLFLLIFSPCGAADSPTPPPDSRVLSQTDHYIIYQRPDGQNRILFDARHALGTRTPSPGRNRSPDTWAGIWNGRAIVVTGLHRATGAANGQTIPAKLGGTEYTGWLDYSYQEYQIIAYDHPAPLKGMHVDANLGEAVTRFCRQLLGALKRKP